MDKGAYHAAASQERARRLARTTDLLAHLYVRGYECGLRDQKASDWAWWEGTRAMVDMFERGVAAGLRRRAAKRLDT
jgi:hypothetical protein